MEGVAVLILVFGVGGQVLNIVALVRTYKTPEWAYDRLSLARSAQLGKHWIGVFTGLGPFFGLHWHIKIRPELDKLRIAADGAQASWSPPAAPNTDSPSTRLSRQHPKRPNLPDTSNSHSPPPSRSNISNELVVQEENRALSVQYTEALKFRSVAPVSGEQVRNAVGSGSSDFQVTQELLTGIALSERLKTGSDAERISGFELAEYFSHGTKVGRLLFGFHPKANYLLNKSTGHDSEGNISAVRDDAEYLESLTLEVLENFMNTLPAGVGQFLSSSLAEEEVSQSEAKLFTHIFLAGIAYVGFQAP